MVRWNHGERGDYLPATRHTEIVSVPAFGVRTTRHTGVEAVPNVLNFALTVRSKRLDTSTVAPVDGNSPGIAARARFC